ncbi:NAD(P)-dependent oxidoreductase [Campylobacter sp. RM13119]|uniref:NmrA family NAD(P)-binding protein n=1 Tax=Campylobacter californiensis TaxID=1032243 RepID=UPI0014741A15|nr:NmrA family NAD(P)-binding protein [Campylobacter sp. RM13119]MBE3607086.1 NAD(P)-dependent oxidoreductase [Campylobacter sp. RM13119]
MIIGNGQLAKAFQKSKLKDNVCIFASGVSNSSCVDEEQFERERKLLMDTLKSIGNKKFVYFSSCALSAPEYPKNDYYKHKENMENTIKQYSKNYYIFRIPQLFGDLILHNTLINFIYKVIGHDHKFNVYDESYRYVIEINDVRKLVENYLDTPSCITVDLANPYRYKVLDIVKIFEKLFGKKANYELVQKEDQYTLDLTSLEKFVKNKKIDIEFGEEYLVNKLREKL